MCPSRNGTRSVQRGGKYCSIWHAKIPENSHRKFWLNGTRPLCLRINCQFFSALFMHFDWFLLMIYWGTDVQMTSSLNTFPCWFFFLNGTKFWKVRGHFTRFGEQRCRKKSCRNCGQIPKAKRRKILEQSQLSTTKQNTCDLLNKRTAMWNLFVK